MGTVLTRVEMSFFVAYLLGFIGMLVPLVCLGPHGNARDVFTVFLDRGGRSSQGLSFFVSISSNAFAFLGKSLVPSNLSHILNLVHRR